MRATLLMLGCIAVDRDDLPPDAIFAPFRDGLSSGDAAASISHDGEGIPEEGFAGWGSPPGESGVARGAGVLRCSRGLLSA